MQILQFLGSDDSIEIVFGGIMRERKYEGEHLMISEVVGRFETLFAPTLTTIQKLLWKVRRSPRRVH